VGGSGNVIHGTADALKLYKKHALAKARLIINFHALITIDCAKGISIDLYGYF
jgi:hypothetical protein